MTSYRLLFFCGLISFALCARGNASDHWVGTWVSAQQLTEPGNMPPAPGLTGETLREIIHPTLSGPRLRLVLSNVFGNAPLVLDAVRVAQSAGASAISPATDTAVTFNGSQAITIPPGASLLSDPVSFAVVAQRDIAVSLSVRSAPAALTGHPGSRTTSYIQAGDLAGAADLPKAHAVDHWYLLAEVDVPAAPPASAVIVIGDSITDGRGSTTNGNNRWPDNLARRLEADPATAGIAVLNQGIGGNALLHGGLGPTALARFDRDVLGPCGGRWLIVFEGINDLGGATGARAHGRPATTAADLIGALRQIAERGHSHGLRVYGATITPFSGFTMYYTPESEADRRAINQWIRTTSELDAVIDFDAAVRDPADASRLVAAYDCGDHLHLSVAGYERLAASIDLKLFQP